MVCKICGSEQRFALTHTVLARHRADLWLCGTCGFLSVADPFWLDEAYSGAVAALDTGVAVRNQTVAVQLAVILASGFPDGPYLDVGGGHGLLVRLMRDLGFDFRWSDRFAENLFARGFEEDGSRYQVVVAIEVLEHLTDPMLSVADWIGASSAEAFIFTQELFHGIPPPDWWYYARAAGQHISFYQASTLRHMADQVGMTYAPVAGLHVFSRRPVTWRRLLDVANKSGAAPLIARLIRSRRGSLTLSDFDSLRS